MPGSSRTRSPPGGSWGRLHPGRQRAESRKPDPGEREIINVADGGSLWAGTYDEKFTDVFSVQNTISQKVADALALSLSGAEKERFTKRDTSDVGAYQLDLTGRYHWNKLTPPEIRLSIGFYQQAIALDPKYALAYFGLAEAYRSLAITADVPPREVCPQAIAAAQKAIELDDSLAEAHASLVFSYVWYDWAWAEAEKEAKRAIELNPNSAFAHLAYAHLLSALGRHQEAIREGRRAVDLDPVSLLVNALDGAFLYHARRNDEAVVQLQKTLELDQNFWIAHLFLGKAIMDRGQYPEAIAEFTKARDFSGGNSEAILDDRLHLGTRGRRHKSVRNARSIPRAVRPALYPAL